ncbi:MAG: pro-sigmaK processing inhibitor BofA family protein [Clostridia bacterium]
MNLFSYSTLTVAAAVIGILLLLRIFTRPIKKIFKFLLHAVFGFVLLWIVNYFGASLGIVLELSLVNCLVAGFIGIPGVLILLAIQYLL